MRQYGIVIIICIFGIVLIVVIFGIFTTLTSFAASFRAGEGALGDFIVYFFTFLKWAVTIGGILGGIWLATRVYWSLHKTLAPTAEGNYPALVSPRMRVTSVAAGNGPAPSHWHQEIAYAPQAQIPATTSVSSGDQELPSAPPFAQIAHLITPEHLPLNYIASGPVYGQVDDLLSMALIGKPKRGKTTSLLYYLCILLKAGAEVWIWDPHGEMSELAYGLHYFTDLEDIAASAVLLEKELNERNQMYKTQNKRVKHPLVLLIDEVPVIARWEQIQRKQKRSLEVSPYSVMERFTLEARKWRGFVFISGQSLPANVLPTLTRDNLSSRLVLECSADHARMIGLPKDTIDNLLPRLKGAERGTHIADFSSWSRPELADIPYTTIDDLKSIIDGRGTWQSENTVNTFTDSFTEDMEPLEYIHPIFTRRSQNLEKTPFSVVTGELVNAVVNEPMNGSESIIQVSPEEEAKILQLAKIQKKMYGRVVRTKIRDALGWNNKDFPKIKQVLDKAGL